MDALILYHGELQKHMAFRMDHMTERTEFRYLKFESPPRKGEIVVSGVGGGEVMPPCIVDRPGGTGDRLLMLFYDPVEFEDRSCPGSTLRLWREGAGHCYGNREREWRHSWIHFHGSGIPALLAGAGAPEEFILSGAELPFFESYLALIYREITGKADSRLWKALLEAFFFEIGRHLESPQIIPEEYLVIRRHIENFPERSLGLKELAHMANRSIPAFTVNFRRYFGVSPIRHQLNCRMELAKLLLHDRNLSIKEIGVRCGYADPFQFSRMFRRRYGCPPTQCR